MKNRTAQMQTRRMQWRPRPPRAAERGPATVQPAKPSLADFPPDARWMVEAYGE
jgi:hypothetical protein